MGGICTRTWRRAAWYWRPGVGTAGKTRPARGGSTLATDLARLVTPRLPRPTGLVGLSAIGFRRPEGQICLAVPRRIHGAPPTRRPVSVFRRTHTLHEVPGLARAPEISHRKTPPLGIGWAAATRKVFAHAAIDDLPGKNKHCGPTRLRWLRHGPRFRALRAF